VPGTVTDFYESVGVERGVASRPEPSHIWLRSLLSVKYLFDDDNREDINTFGWKKLDKQNGFTIWENTNYVPFGFTYENYVTKKQFENTDKNSREKLLLNAIYLNDEQISKYGGLLTQMDDDKVGYFSDEEMVNACNERRKSTVNDFKRDSRGFEGNITLNKSNLVFFSVPFEEGWTATVNGQSVKIEKVNSGFMAILCPSGTSNIRFNYFTPGLLYGLLISLGAILLFAGYMYFNKRSEK
jgi:uncharacterized membrane protein YfhO